MIPRLKTKCGRWWPANAIIQVRRSFPFLFCVLFLIYFVSPVTQCKKRFSRLISRFLQIHEQILSGSISLQNGKKQFPYYDSMQYATAFFQYGELMQDPDDHQDQEYEDEPMNERFSQGRNSFDSSSYSQNYGPAGPQMGRNFPDRSSFGPPPHNLYPQGNPSASFSRPSQFNPSGMGGGMGMGMGSNLNNSMNGMNFPNNNFNSNNINRMDFMNDGRPPNMPQNPSQRNSNLHQQPGRNYDDSGAERDWSHVDFFFRGISQQVKRAHLNGEEFLDLQATILNVLSSKLPSYQ